MSFSEELIKQLEPVIEELLKKHDEDRISAFKELLDSYEQEILNGFALINEADNINNASELFTNINNTEEPVKDSAEEDTVDNSKLESIEENTKSILGVVSDIKINVESITSANEKAIKGLQSKYEVSDEKVNKKLTKLEKTAKKTESNTNKTKERLKKIGKWLTAFLVLFFAGDVLKDLVVNAFDKVIHSDFMRKIKNVIDQTFPRFGRFLTQSAEWWETKAKPWLDQHTFAEFFSDAFTKIGDIYNTIVNDIYPGFVKILNKLGITHVQTNDAAADYNANVWNKALGRETISIDPSKYKGIVDEQTLKALLATYPEGVVTRILQQEALYKKNNPNQKTRTIDPISGAELVQLPTDFVANVADPYRDKWYKDDTLLSEKEMNRVIKSAEDKYFVDQTPESVRSNYRESFQGLYEATLEASPKIGANGYLEGQEEKFSTAAEKRASAAEKAPTTLSNTTVVYNYYNNVNSSGDASPEQQ